MFASQNHLKHYLKAVSGIAFFATPHITKRNDETAQQLAGILRCHNTSPGFVVKEDLTELVWSTLQFAGLRLHCFILSCYEQKSIEIKDGIPGQRPLRALVRC